MTAAPVDVTPGHTPAATAEGGPTFVNVLRSEWIKLWSLRSTGWTLLAMVVTTVGIGVLASWGNSQQLNDPDTVDPTMISLTGLALAQIAVSVLGVLTITGEYGSGAIRTSLTVVPNRLRLFAAKATVLAVVAGVLGFVTSAIAFTAGQTFWSVHHIGGSWTNGTDVRAVIGAGLYLAATSLFGFGLGALLRHTAGGITASIAGLLVLPGLTHAIPGAVGRGIVRYFISNAGAQILRTISPERAGDRNVLGPWVGFGVFALWCAVLLGAAAWLMLRRDA